MTACFACLTWPDGNEEASRQAGRLIAALESFHPHLPHKFRMDGLYLADLRPGSQPGSRILPLRPQMGKSAGAVFGTLFRRQPGSRPPLTRLSPDEAQLICRTQGDAILTGYWGHFVLFLKTGNTSCLLTDPVSAIPCFYRRVGEITCIFSHLEACPDEFATDLTLDFAFLRRLRVYDKIQTGQTAYQEIRELGGGQRLDLARPQARPDPVWDPRQIAGRPLRLSDSGAAEALRNTVYDCVGSWASAWEHIVMDLSGGLDSSIVTACLARHASVTRLDILHHHVRSADAPELSYAQATSDHLGLPLLSLAVSPSRPLPDPESHPPSVRPWRHFLGLGFETLLPEELKAPATITFTGQGGDHLFLMTRSPLGLADCIRQGAFARLLPEWLNAARLSDTSLWQTLAGNVPYLLGRPARSALKTGLLARIRQSAVLGSEEIDWLEGLPDWALEPGDLPPGKFEQISTLPHLFQIRDPLCLSGARQVHHPLISLPLIEVCLRVPVWQLCLGGVNRGLARKAFSDDLPERVRLRTTKGEATQYYAQQLAHNRAQVAGILSDGALMQTGLLGRAELDGLLADRAMTAPATFRDLLQLYTLEAWMRSSRSGRRLPRLA